MDSSECQPVAPVRRDKPRLSAAQKRQLKKKESTEMKRKTDELDSPIVVNEQSTLPFVENRISLDDRAGDISDGSSENSTTVITPSLVKKPSTLVIDVTRQLSDSSNFVAQKCIENLAEDGRQVQKALLYVSKAHRVGIISVRQKAELKDILLTKGSNAVINRLLTYPGSAALLKSDPIKEATSAVKTSSMGRDSKFASASRYHVFRNLSGYSITMYVGEALRMEMAIKNGREHCAVTSSFVAIQPSRIAEGLHKGSKQVLEEPNAGGKSFNSEALSFETLQALFGASNLVTEMNVQYVMRHTSIVDYICNILGHRVGVSVTRAMHFLGEENFTHLEAQTLLQKKMAGLDRAGNYVCEEYKFDRQILHIWAQSDRVCQLVRAEFESLNPNLFKPTICLITVCEHFDDSFVFHNNPEIDPNKAHDPLWHEEMKRRLRREESERVTRLVQRRSQREGESQSAIRRIFSKPLDDGKD